MVDHGERRDVYLVLTAGLCQRMNNNLKEMQIHVTAMVKMVKMRGGLDRLGWHGVLQMILLW